MKKIPLKEGTRKRQNKIRKIVAAGLPLAALMTGLAGSSSGKELARPTPGVPPREKSQADKRVYPVVGKQPVRGEMPIEKKPENIHVVRNGDTLSSIARKYGTTVAELKKLNNLTDEQIHMIRIGQEIKIK